MATENEARDDVVNGARKVPVVVAIGASAGGVQALQNLFSGIPQDTGAAFIVVVHLDPQHRSELSAIVAARTAFLADRSWRSAGARAQPAPWSWRRRPPLGDAGGWRRRSRDTARSRALLFLLGS